VVPTVRSRPQLLPVAPASSSAPPEETAVAIAQASRFSQVCKVYTPMYPQLTTTGIGLGGDKIEPRAAATAYLGVLAAWKDFGNEREAALAIVSTRHEIGRKLPHRPGGLGHSSPRAGSWLGGARFT
jgi:hypothetical protein